MLDKKWIEVDNRASMVYIEGVDKFLNFAFDQPGVSDKIRCPCNSCRNTAYKYRREVRFHLFNKGFVKSYKTWLLHGEKFGESSDTSNIVHNDNMENLNNNEMLRMVHDTFDFFDTGIQNEENSQEEPNKEAKNFYRLLEDANVDLYPNSKLSKLSFIVKLLHMKCLNNLTNVAMNDMLSLHKESLPENALIPDSYYDAKKIIRDLGLDYVKIHACNNDCILYWREHEHAQSCPVCGLSRWKVEKKRSKIPCKVLRHFPLKPRLQWLFLSRDVAKEMRWHKEKRVDDGIMRHPADSMAWKSFDEQHKLFAVDPRNVRLGLASDGFNPYSNMSTSHSIWPVVLAPYNLPPWLCMKQPYLMMSLLIPGPKSPGNDIDVYLQPLIEELKELWEDGINSYDAYAQQNFKLHAAILWTINDFPAYGNLSGWSTKGKLACPCCHKHTCSTSLRNKLCYMDHRRFLPINHAWRKNRRSFNGKVDDRQSPRMLTGDDVLSQLNSSNNVTFGKDKKRKRNVLNIVYNWKKKSIFFELPYWKTLLLRHNLDVMHIERNVSDNILNTIMNMKGKTKDTLKSRYDLVDLKIRQNLHPQVIGDKVLIPAACYALSSTEKEIVCKFLKNLKVPDGFSSNISRCVNVNGKIISGLKCHDHHILLQQIIPLAIRGLLPKNVFEPLLEISKFFNILCSKTLVSDDLDILESQIVITLCKLETIFPPAFFDIMLHLPIHLAREAKIAGPVQYRWMYPIERYLRTLKSYVRNKARPEGSIAEGYIANECLTFCSRYIHGARTKFNKASRNDDEITNQRGLSIFRKCGYAKGAFKPCHLNDEEFDQACTYVLQNCEEVWPFIEEHKSEITEHSQRHVLERHNKEFPSWFYKRVSKLQAEGRASVDLLNLSFGPMRVAHQYSIYIVNGFRFHTKDHSIGKNTQNSGILVKGDDVSPEKEYYGVLESILELSYVGGNKVTIFKCHWWDVARAGRGYKTDNYGYTSVNVHKSLSINEPFVLASQAEQVFYVEDLANKDWLVVIKTIPRDLYNMPLDDEQNRDESDADFLVHGDDAYQEEDMDGAFSANPFLENDDITIMLTRDDIEPDFLPATVLDKTKNATFENFINEDDDDVDEADENEHSSVNCTDDD